MGLYGGGGGGGGGSDDVIRQQNEQARKQYEYDKNVYDFQWEGSVANPQGQQWKAFNHAVEGFEIQQANDQAQRDYQNETARKNWEHGMSIQDYQWEQQNRAFEKSETQFGSTITANALALEQGLEREQLVLEEQFIDMAFQNKSLIQDLYEATGAAGFDKAAVMLGLEQTEGDLDFQNVQKLTALKQGIGQAEFATAGKQLQMVDQRGRTDFSKQSTIQDLYTKEALNRFSEVGIDLNVKQAKSREQYENDVLMRQYADSRSKAAYDTQQMYVESLQKAGQAQLSQSGRSQGKAIQMVFAELGRSQNYLVDTLIRGKATADAQIRNNKINTLNVQAQAKLAKAKLDYSTLDNITKARMSIEEADRSLKIGEKKGDLDLDQIRSQVVDAVENTDIDVDNIARNLKQSQKKAGFDTRKIDWDVTNFGSRFEHNQHVLRASLDSAVKSSAIQRKDLALSKYGADLEAEARRMLLPQEAPRPDAPLAIPVPIYQDPLAPEKPPEPIEGALMQQSSGSSFAQVGGAVLGGALAGFGTYAALGGMKAGATFATAGGGWAGPLGIAVGLGTMLFG